MNHNTARCVGCNSVVRLPHLRARASAAKCEACARREAERVRDSRAFETEPRDPFLNNMVGPPRGSFECILKRVYADDFRITVPRDAVIYDDKREQRVRELTEEKRREKRVTCRPVMDPGDLCGGCDDCMEDAARHWQHASVLHDVMSYAFDYDAAVAARRSAR